MTGIFVTDCSSTDWAWLDPGCIIQNVGADLGGTVGGALQNALAPLWTPLLVILVGIIIIVVIIGFAPNVKHIVPHIGLN